MTSAGRFQEIGGVLESALSTPVTLSSATGWCANSYYILDVTLPGSCSSWTKIASSVLLYCCVIDVPFKLAATASLWQCVHQCWHHSIFVPALCHRFWKLTVQLFSRYSLALAEVADAEVRLLPLDATLYVVTKSIEWSKQVFVDRA